MKQFTETRGAKMKKPADTPPQNGSDECTVCGSKSRGKPLCYPCYKEKEFLKKELQSNRNAQEVRDHYFNQRRLLYKVKNPEYTKTGMLKMVALSEELSTFHEDRYLKRRLLDDIIALRDYMAGKPKEPEKEKKSFDDEDFRKQFPAELHCEDGHYVRSKAEMLIDNWLYQHGIVHAYEKSVFMATDPSAVVLSDFYVPEGKVYIEFWGLSEDEKYQKRKKFKQRLYKENKLKLIELEEKDVKRLGDIMPRKLHDYLPDKKFE